MKTLLKSEELIQFLGAIYVFSRLDFAGWWFPVLLLLPDLSMVGYLVNPAVGAVLYNVAHHKGLAVGLGLLGLMLARQCTDGRQVDRQFGVQGRTPGK